LADLDLLHFEQLKSEIQARYLENHIPSDENIANWKGIDIIYFQEDLRKQTKANISEKSFYTYFKASPVLKLPRIDILNLLSIYVGYISWYDFRKNHLFAEEILENYTEETTSEEENSVEIEEKKPIFYDNSTLENKKIEVVAKPEIQLNNTENQTSTSIKSNIESIKRDKKSYKDYFFAAATIVLAIIVGILGFGNAIFGKTYTYNFADADRNSPIQNTLEIKVIKENESPVFFRIAPTKAFIYSTKDEVLKMEISSPFYEDLKISRNLENAPDEETIELKPDDYKMAVYYFSKKDMRDSAEQIKLKRRQLERYISDNAIIYQVFDSEIYGVETLDKQKYITLVTTPTTSLKNLNVIDMTREKGKIVAIKFKIDNDKIIDNENK
jgi:hypothetical protein